MSKSIINGVVIYCILLFILSTSFFTQKSLVLSLSVGDRILERPDPLRQFKLYNGTYDIRNDHYWSSAAFTGIHGYAMAGIWLLFGLGFGSYIIFKNLNRNDPEIIDHPNSSYVIMFSLIVLFTLLAIVATGVIMAANKSFLHRGRKLTETISNAGLQAYKSIRKVINVLVQMQKRLKPYDSKTCHFLNTTSHRLRRESLTIQNFVDKTKKKSGEAVETLYIGNLVVASVNLILLIAALVLLVMHCYPGIIIILFCCWILTTLSWFLTGLDFLSHTFAEDTCSAIEEFEQNPQHNSLQIMLPCGNSKQSNEILKQIGYTVHSYIFQINTKISESLETLGFEDDILGVHQICDPFSGAPDYSYRPEQCPQHAITIGDLANILPRFTCFEENSTENCAGDGRFLSESSYVMALAISQSIQDLLNVFPDLVNLTQCSTVKEAFSDITQHQCAPFRRSTEIIWASMLSLSIAMVVVEILWIIKVYQDRGKKFSAFSIIPRAAEGNGLPRTTRSV